MVRFALGSRDIAQIVAVADAGSIRRAAEALGLTQPGLSKNVRQIEQRLGAQLFDRSSGRARPTQLGEQLLERGRRILLDLAAIERDLMRMGKDACGQVRIGAGPIAAPTVAEHVLPKLLATLPGLDVHLRVGTAYELIGELEQGSLDLLVSFTESLPFSDRLVSTPLREVSGFWFARRSHPLFAFNRVTLAQLLAYPLALPTLYPRMKASLTVDGVEPRVRLQCDQYDVLVAAVHKSDMVGVMTPHLLARYQAQYDIVGLEVEDWHFEHSIHCIHARDCLAESLVGKVRALIQAELATVDL